MGISQVYRVPVNLDHIGVNPVLIGVQLLEQLVCALAVCHDLDTPQRLPLRTISVRGSSAGVNPFRAGLYRSRILLHSINPRIVYCFLITNAMLTDSIPDLE